ANTFLGEMGFERAAPVRRETEAEFLDRVFRDTAPAQIIEADTAVRHSQLAFEKAAGHFDDIAQSFRALLAFALARIEARHFHARVARKPFDRFGERQLVDVHHEIDDAAVRAAAEAVIETLFLVDGE